MKQFVVSIAALTLFTSLFSHGAEASNSSWIDWCCSSLRSCFVASHYKNGEAQPLASDNSDMADYGLTSTGLAVQQTEFESDDDVVRSDSEEDGVDLFNEIFLPLGLFEDKDGRTELHRAFIAGDLQRLDAVFSSLDCKEFIKELVRNDNDGKSPILYAKERGLSLLHIGVISNNAEVIKALFMLIGGSVWCRALCAQDGLGRTPLHYAALKGNVQLMRNLVYMLGSGELDQVFGIADQFGNKPVFYAGYSKWNLFHLTAIYPDPAVTGWACSMYKEKAATLALLNARDVRNRTPYDIASELGHSEVCNAINSIQRWAQS